MTEYTVVKRDKRLYIISPDGEEIYTPPNFLIPKIVDRRGLQNLAARFNNAGKYDIFAVMEFECGDIASLRKYHK